MSPDMLVLIRKFKIDIRQTMEYGSQLNYGKMSEKLKNMYLELSNLEGLMDGHLNGIQAEKVILDATGGMLDEETK